MFSAVLPYSIRECHWPFYKSLYTLKSEILYTVKKKLFGQVLTAVILKQCFGSNQKYDFISFWVSTRSHMTQIEVEEGWEQEACSVAFPVELRLCKRKWQRNCIYPGCWLYDRWSLRYYVKKWKSCTTNLLPKVRSWSVKLGDETTL